MECKLETKSEGKNRERESVLVSSRPQKLGMTLPKEAGEALRSLALPERKAYATELHNAGWTFQSIATELNLTREAIRLYALVEHTSEAIWNVSMLPLPSVPTVEVYKDMVKRIKPEPKVLERLKELQPIAM